MLTKKQTKQIKEELDYCAKPIFFFDDDYDGLCAFLVLYKYKKEGKGICIKGSHNLNPAMADKAKEYGADKIFVLDIHAIPDAFIEATDLPIVWIDHHGKEEVDNKQIKYFNPLLNDPDCYIPTSQICYDAVKTSNWLAAIGIIGDYAVPSFLKDIVKEYPKLLEKTSKDPGYLKYETKLGKLVQMFNFLLMGATTRINTNIKILTRIEDPMEIYNGKTSRAKYLKKHFEKFYGPYEEHIKKANKIEPEGNFYSYVYDDQKVSITKDLANELSYIHRDLFVLIARLKDEHYRVSMRYSKGDINDFIGKVMQGIDGKIGGHPYAMGGLVHKDSWDQFVNNLKDVLNK